MTDAQYYELMGRLNFSENSIGIKAYSLDEPEGIKELLLQLGYEPIGMQISLVLKDYDFKDKNNQLYSIVEHNNRLIVCKTSWMG